MSVPPALPSSKMQRCGVIHKRTGRCEACLAISRQVARRRESLDDLRRWILDRDGHRCQVCGDPGDTVDHRVPIQSGGRNDPDNLWTLCLACNSSKGTKDYDEWIAQRRAKGLPCPG